MRRFKPSDPNRIVHFAHFRGYALPYSNLTAPVDVTQLVKRCRERDARIFPATLYAVTRAANSVPQLRQRIRGDEIVEHDSVHPSFTTLLSDETLRFCPTTYSDDRSEFLASVEQAQNAARASPNVAIDPVLERDDLLFVSALPWLAFTSIQHPAQTHADDSVPRIAWGKITVASEGKEQRSMPLSLQVHHALVDGLHMARFFEQAQLELDRDW